MFKYCRVFMIYKMLIVILKLVWFFIFHHEALRLTFDVFLGSSAGKGGG